jgi:TP901 family phage tail tape measure protein
MAELKTLNALAGDVETRLAGLNSTRLANSNLIQNVQSVAAPKFQWDEGLRQTDLFVKNLQRGKMEINNMRDLMDKLGQQSRSMAENQARLANAAVRQGPGGQTQMYLPSVNDVRAFNDGLEVSSRRLGLQNEMLRVTSTQIQNWGKNIQWAGRQLLVGFTVPFAAAAAAAGVYAFSIDKEITRITKVYDGAQGEVRGLALETASTVSKTMGQASKDTLDVMAQLAAIGKTGAELKQSTIEVQRLSTLGEMDSQTSLESIIALQATYSMSTRETAEAINYMNAVENATSLSMQDFAKSIPVVASTMSQLGGTIQDTGTLLVAMKEKGIDAVEGSNGIKSMMNRLLNPSKQVQETFKELTKGLDLKEVVNSTNGEVLPTMEKLADIIMNGNISIIDQQRLIGQLAGSYQMTRMNALLDGLAHSSTQVTKAMEVANQGSGKWAAAAAKELETQTQSISGKFKIAVQTFKDELLGFGEVALQIATFVMTKVGAVVAALNDMPDWLKGVLLLGGGLLAIAGPITMLVGIFGNFIGTLGRGIAAIKNIGNGYKSMTIESKVAEIAAGNLSSKFASEADMIQVLIFQVDKLTRAYTQNATAANMVTASGTKMATSKSTDPFIAYAATSKDLEGQSKIAQKELAATKANEIAQAEKLAYLMSARSNLVNSSPMDKMYYEKYGKMYSQNSQNEFNKLTSDIKNQEAILTQAINHRKATTQQALDVENNMLRHNSTVKAEIAKRDNEIAREALREQAAVSKAQAVAAAGNAAAMPAIISANGKDYKQNSAGRWTNGKGFATKEEFKDINEGFSQVTTNAGAATQAIDRTSIASRVFRQETLLGVSAVAAMGGAVAEAGSGWSKWLNGIAIGTGVLSIIAPAFGSIKDFIMKQNFVGALLGSASSNKQKAGQALGAIGSSVTDFFGKYGKALGLWGMAAGAAALVAWGTYKLVTAEGQKQVQHQRDLANTTDGWMKTLGQAKLEWGQIKDASGATKDNMSGMSNKLREENKDLVQEAAKAQNGGLDRVLRYEVYRLQGQGLSQDDIMKSMETLLNAAGKSKKQIEEALKNIKITFDFKGPTADMDDFLKDIKKRTRDANVFEGAFQGGVGFFNESYQPTDQGRAGIELTASLIKDRLVGLDDTTRKYVSGKIADQLNGAFDDSFTELKKKYGDQIKGSWQDAAKDLLVFDDKQDGFRPNTKFGSDPNKSQTELALLLNNNRVLAIKLKDALNLPIQNKDIKNFGDIVKYIGNSTQSASDTQKEYNEAVKKTEASSGKLTDSQKIQLAQIYAGVRGLDAAKLAANGYSDAQKNTTKAIDDANRGIGQLVDNLKKARDAHGDFTGAMSGTGDFWNNSADSETGFGGLGGDPKSQGNMINDAMKNAYSNTMGTVYDIAGTQMDQQFKARMDGIADYYSGIKDRLEDESKALDKSWDARMQAFADSWKDKMDQTKTSFDDRKKAIENEAKAQLKSIDDQIEAIQKEKEANQELDDQRKRMFEAEERRIERLTELANNNISYNRALATGNLDEAARVMNNSERLQVSWGAEDSQLAADEKARARDKAAEAQVDELQNRKDSINEAKDAKLDALAEEEDAVMKSLEKQQEMEKRNLEIQKDNEKERLQDRIDGLAKEQAAVEETERSKQEMNRRTLEIQLATLRAFVPMNEQQLWEHIARVQGAYSEHGVELTIKGTQWGQIVGTALQTNVDAARVQMSNSADWQTSGAQIGDAISKGAFGLTLGEFFNMIISGQPPEGWKPPGASAGFSNIGKPTVGAFHVGGMVGRDMGGRLGRTGDLHPDEKMAILQHGEYVLDKKTVDRIGTGNIDAVMSGQMGIGGADLGIAGIAGGMAATLMRSMIMAAFLGSQKQQEEFAANGFMGSIAQQPGMYGGIPLSEEQLLNANTIASVGSSMGASTRDIIISLMTAMQESGLRNLNYGDRDSVGLFQQRTSQGWGTIEQIMNPTYAATKFFEGLLNIPNRNAMSLTQAAQAVQRSAFPDAYAQWQSMAEAVVGAGAGTAMNDGTLPGFGMFLRMAQSAMSGGGAGAAGSGQYIRPTNGPITSEYGWRTDPFTGAQSLHDGIDIGAASGTPIYATDTGRVIQVGDSGSGFGNWTLIDHGNGVISGYAHQSSYAVNNGQNVGRGQTIGYVGSTGRSTGPHLHFQMGPGPGNFQNPRNYIPSLSTGGTVNYDNVLANLHKDEKVLTAPLSRSLERGINNLDSAGSSVYYVDVNINGSGLSAKELKAVVSDVFEEKNLLAARKTGKVR